ncbi:hypothetical protein ACRALDRAFT_2017658 [Sodiomyces alcalophilus JCM 7366]|uniref:uncharacterized protein n=1 Tax=Sodiomyces alcalophilus JCM 7366 TaxID=591952 RepID=UPI0039B5B26E
MDYRAVQIHYIYKAFRALIGTHGTNKEYSFVSIKMEFKALAIKGGFAPKQRAISRFASFFAIPLPSAAQSHSVAVVSTDEAITQDKSDCHSNVACLKKQKEMKQGM